MPAATLSCDVLVVGGGAAGVAAATAAGRAGAQVILLERYGFLGGLATAAQVGTICGLYLRDEKGPAAEPVGGAFPREFALSLEQASRRPPIRVDAGLWVLPYSIPAFARVADQLVTGAGAVTVILHATLAEAKAGASQIVEIRALAWNELLRVRPRTVVDCTGEATVVALAGGSVEDAAGDQAPSLVFVLEDVDPALAERGLLEVRRELRRAVQQGVLPEPCERIALVPGAGQHGRLALKLNLPVAAPEVSLWQQVTTWEREGRGRVEELVRFLKENTTSCRQARLASVAPQVGIRSGRRIRGRATLPDEAVLGAAKCPTGIARGAWPMERWGNNRRPDLTFFHERDFYEIPLDCLRPVELDNVLVAGRCLSAAAGAMSSARVIGTALATGWAAGTVAAGQALGRPLDAAVDGIRKQLEDVSHRSDSYS